MELIERGPPAAPIHHEGGPHRLHRSEERLGDEALAELVAQVRASVARATAAALDDLTATLPAPIRSISLRAWPQSFPDDIAVLRRAPYESHTDSVMYRQVLAELAEGRGWSVLHYAGASVEAEAASLLGDRAQEVLQSPRQTLGPPWTKDHRMALAATVLAPNTPGR